MTARRAPHPIVCQRYNLSDRRCILLWIRRKFWAAR